MSKYPHGHSTLIKGCRRYDTGEVSITLLKRWRHFKFPTRHFRARMWIAKVNSVDKQLDKKYNL
jgi:hypothetical protein